MPHPKTSLVNRYVDRINRLVGDNQRIFRGQSDASWPLASAAARRIDETQKLADKGGEESEIASAKLLDFKEYHRNLIKSARSRGHGHDGARELHDLEILAKLQHYGAATAFMDFTKNPYVALWFRCQFTGGGRAGVAKCLFSIIPMHSNSALLMRLEFSGDDKKEIKDFLTHPSAVPSFMVGRLPTSYWYWEAQRVREQRIIRQSSIFVFGLPKIDKTEYQSIFIAERAKKQILRDLERLHDISAETLFPDFPGFATANSATTPLRLKTAKDYFVEGNQFAQKKKHKLAVDSYSKAIKINPKYAGAYVNRGASHATLDNHQQAIDDYNKAVKIDPKNAFAYNNSGNSYAKLYNYQKSIDNYGEAVKIDPEYAIAYFNRGLRYAELGDHEEAIRDYSKAIKIDPESALAYSSRGFSHAELGNHQKAVSDYSKAIKINPKDIVAYNVRGFIFAKLGNHQKAVSDYSKAIKINPESAFAYISRGRSQAELGNHQKAVSDYSKAIKIDPENINAHNNRGNCYAELGNHQKAVSDYNEAIKIDPKCADAYGNRALSYLELGGCEREQAIKDVYTALELATARG